MNRIIALVLACWMLHGPTTVHAGQVHLTNGDRITGTIEKSDLESLQLKSELAGTVSLKWSAVARLISEESLYVTLKGDQVIVGALDTVDGRISIRTREAGTVTVEKDTILGIRSEAQQTAYLAELERLQNPRLTDLWAGSADVGLSLTAGNSETSTLSLGMKAARTTRRDKTSVYLNSIRTETSTTGTSITTANATWGGIRYDVTFNSRLFAFATADLEFNEIQKLDLRMVLGGGLGYHAVDSDRTTLDFFAGGASNREHFLTGLRRTSGEVLLGEELTHRLWGRTTLSEKAIFYTNMNRLGDYRFTFDASAVTNLSTWLAWHVTLGNRFNSSPVPGAEKNDLLLSTGVRFTFGTRR